MSDAAVEALRAFGIDHEELVPLAGGASTAIWKVVDAEHSYVLRCHDRRYSCIDVASELVWLEAVDEGTILRIPAPVRQANGELAPVTQTDAQGRRQSLWTMLCWVAGENLGRLPLEDEARLIGYMLAELHLFGKRWSPLPGFSRPSYNGAYFEATARKLLPRIDAYLNDDMRLQLDTALKRSTNVLDRLGRDAEQQFGLIHADVHDGNVVFDDNSAQVGIIDFGRFGFGCWALDVAMAMHYLTEELGKPLLEAYIQRHPLTADAHRALPYFRFLAAIDNFSFLAANAEEVESISLELPDLLAQAEQLVG